MSRSHDSSDSRPCDPQKMEMAAMHHLSLEIVFLVWNIPFRMPDWGEKNECLPGVPGIVSEKSQ